MCKGMCMGMCWSFSLLNRFDHAIYQLKYHELQINVTVWVFKSISHCQLVSQRREWEQGFLD